MQMLGQLLERFDGLSETNQIVIIISAIILIVVLCTLGIMTALKRGVKTHILAIPWGVFLLIMMVLVIKTMYDRHDGGPLWYIFFALVPFLGYAGAISQLEDIKRRMGEAKEYKRTGKRPERTKLEKNIAIISLVVLAIDLVITFTVSKKAGLAFMWFSVFCATAITIVKPELIIKTKEDLDDETRNRIIKSTRFSAVISSCFILFVAYLTLSN